jgi:hypothetical protein
MLLFIKQQSSLARQASILNTYNLTLPLLYIVDTVGHAQTIHPKNK